MSDDLRQIVDNYCRTWDVDAPKDLIEDVYAPTLWITILNRAKRQELKA